MLGEIFPKDEPWVYSHLCEYPDDAILQNIPLFMLWIVDVWENRWPIFNNFAMIMRIPEWSLPHVKWKLANVAHLSL